MRGPSVHRVFLSALSPVDWELEREATVPPWDLVGGRLRLNRRLSGGEFLITSGWLIITNIPTRRVLCGSWCPGSRWPRGKRAQLVSTEGLLVAKITEGQWWEIKGLGKPATSSSSSLSRHASSSPLWHIIKGLKAHDAAAAAGAITGFLGVWLITLNNWK